MPWTLTTRTDGGQDGGPGGHRAGAQEGVPGGGDRQRRGRQAEPEPEPPKEDEDPASAERHVCRPALKPAKRGACLDDTAHHACSRTAATTQHSGLRRMAMAGTTGSFGGIRDRQRRLQHPAVASFLQLFLSDPPNTLYRLIVRVI